MIRVLKVALAVSSGIVIAAAGYSFAHHHAVEGVARLVLAFLGAQTLVKLDP